MSPLALLDTLEGLGVRVALTPEGRLRLEPASRVPAELLEAVRKHKAEIKAHLTARTAPPEPPAFLLETWDARDYAGTYRAKPYPANLEPDLLERMIDYGREKCEPAGLEWAVTGYQDSCPTVLACSPESGYRVGGPPGPGKRGRVEA